MPRLFMYLMSSSLKKCSRNRSKKNSDLLAPKTSRISARSGCSAPENPLMKSSKFIQPPMQVPLRRTPLPWASTIWLPLTLKNSMGVLRFSIASVDVSLALSVVCPVAFEPSQRWVWSRISPHSGDCDQSGSDEALWSGGVVGIAWPREHHAVVVRTYGPGSNLAFLLSGLVLAIEPTDDESEDAM